METVSRVQKWRQSFWLRRLPLWVAIGLGALLLFRGSTHEVELVYDLSAVRQGLIGFSVVLAPAEETAVRRTRFFRPASGWSGAVSHTVGLAPGKYRASITLDYSGISPTIERDLEIDRNTQRLVLFLAR